MSFRLQTFVLIFRHERGWPVVDPRSSRLVVFAQLLLPQRDYSHQLKREQRSCGKCTPCAKEESRGNERMFGKIYVPAWSGKTWIHCSSFSLFFPPLPHLSTHSCLSSSQTFLSFTVLLIPLADANLSHFVCGFGFGNGLARGSGVFGLGREARGP